MARVARRHRGGPGRLRVFSAFRQAAVRSRHAAVFVNSNCQQRFWREPAALSERFRFFFLGYARHPVSGPEGDCHKIM